MKKNILLLAVGVIATVSVCAQSLQSVHTVTINTLPADPKNLVRSKALRDFSKTFKNVTGENWYIIDKGFMAKFIQQGIPHRVIYNRMGKWMATFRYYNEAQLPAELRHMIKSTWYDATISLVTEVSYAGKTAYLVNLEENTSLKTIKVVNGEMEVVHEMVKL